MAGPGEADHPVLVGRDDNLVTRISTGQTVRLRNKPTLITAALVAAAVPSLLSTTANAAGSQSVTQSAVSTVLAQLPFLLFPVYRPAASCFS